MSRKTRTARLRLEALEKRELMCFGSLNLFPAGPNPASVAVGDFNHDGNPDLVVPNPGLSRVSVLLGNGDGLFQKAQRYPTAGAPTEVASSDLNEDGFVDLAVVRNGSVGVMLGNGDGSFKKPINFTVSPDPHGLAIADFNGDSHADLVVGSMNVFVSVLLGNGNGTFAPFSNHATGSDPMTVAVADFDDNGIVDIVSANRGGNSASVLLGNGDGTFQLAKNYAAGTAPRAVVTSDFNEDGHADFAVSIYNFSSGFVNVFLGNGDGTFELQSVTSGFHTFDLAVGDFNNDNHVDLTVAISAVNGAVSVLLGNGNGTFQPFVGNRVSGTSRYVAVGDFNNDGFDDHAATSGNNVAVLLSDGVCPAPAPPARRAVGHIVALPGSAVTVSELATAAESDLFSLSNAANELPILPNDGIGIEFSISPKRKLRPAMQSVGLELTLNLYPFVLKEISHDSASDPDTK